MTLKEIFKILNIKIPNNLKSQEEKKIDIITGFLPHVLSKPGLFFDINPELLDSNKIKKALEVGSIIVTNKEYFDESGQKLPTINIKNPKEKYYEFGKYLKKIKKVPTIGITGSIRKSTTTRMANFVFREKYKVFSSASTSNIPEYYIKEMYQHLDDDYNFHIQETGGARPDLVKESVEILDVDAFCLTNINKFHHLDKYETTENLIKDKTSYDRYSKKEAIGVINADDDILYNYKYNRKIITFGINNQKADYIAKNIKQNNNILSLDIYHKNKKEITIKVNIIGKHNAYNVLAVYALAKIFNLTNEQIINGFLKYKSNGLRQNFDIICGRLVYIDCFNVCSDSIKSCLDSLETFEINTNSKKIAILGGENALGEKTYEVNYNTGTELNKYKTIDKFICVGAKNNNTKNINLLGDGKALYDGAKTVLSEEKISFYDDILEVADFIKQETKPGDIILLKGIFRLALIGALDLALGTSYIYDIYYFYNNTLRVSNKNFEGRVIRTIDKIELIKLLNKENNKIVIPNKIDNYQVVHLKKRLCQNAQAKHLKIGKYLTNITEFAFLNCHNLKKIVIPSNIKIIEQKAFSNCESLKIIKMKEGVLQINKNAFSNCSSLKKVYLPKSIVKIESNAFPKNKNIKFITPRNTYCYQHIKKYYHAPTLKIFYRIIRKIKRIIKIK